MESKKSFRTPLACKYSTDSFDFSALKSKREAVMAGLDLEANHDNLNTDSEGMDEELRLELERIRLRDSKPSEEELARIA